MIGRGFDLSHHVVDHVTSHDSVLCHPRSSVKNRDCVVCLLDLIRLHDCAVLGPNSNIISLDSSVEVLGLRSAEVSKQMSICRARLRNTSNVLSYASNVQRPDASSGLT